jgi:predicted restriction endonuclease
MTRNYHDPQYKKWRQSIHQRDNHTCQWPGCLSKKKIHAHHINKWSDFPGLRYHINNGILLCKLHHDLIKDNEENYANFFQTLILQKLKKS